MRILVLCLSIIPVLAAEDAATTPAPQIQLNGYVSTSYSYNLNRPTSGTNQFRVFDFDDDTFKLDVAELTVHRDVSKPGEIGFRVDAAFGSSVPRVTASSGLFRDPQTGKAEDVDLLQGFVSVVVPVGSGLHLDFGKYITHMGYEAIDRFDALNDNGTRSFLFGYAVPYAHTGIRAAYTFSPHVVAQLHVVNGWDNVKDNNRGKSVGFELTWTPKDTLAVILNYMGGPEQTDNDANKRHVGDLVVNWTVSPRLYFGFNADYGHEAGAAPNRGAAVWSGAAIYARLGLGGAWSLAVRGEVFDDRDGTRTGVAQTLREITLTPLYKLAPKGSTTTLILRADLRLDESDQLVFETDRTGEHKKRQPTVYLNAACAF